MFGKKDSTEGETGGAVTTAELDRLTALSLPELAVEVMQHGFGATLEPGWPGRPGVAAVDSLLTTMVPGADTLAPDAYGSAYDLIGEGVQQLEHASLVRLTYLNNVGGRLFAITRLGRTALADETVARYVQ